LIAGTAVSSTYLAGTYHVDCPTFQAFGTYVLIALVYIPLYIYRTNDSFFDLLKAGWWKYAILALVDVEANYTIVKAYQYTSITSVQMLDSATLFFVFIFSLIFLHRKYSKIHYLLIVIVLFGVGLMIYVDVSQSPEDGIGAEWLGSVLVIIACFLYATSNTATEYIVKTDQDGSLVYLSQLGLFGTVFSGLQLYLFERDELASVLSNPDLNLAATGWFFCFWICLFLIYSLMPVAFFLTSAVFTNLGLLTADIYALVLGIFVFEQNFDYLYLISYFVIFGGLVGFHIETWRFDTRLRNAPKDAIEDLVDSSSHTDEATSASDSRLEFAEL